MELPFEQFPALNAIGICRHVFTQRIPGIDVSHDKAEVLKRLDAAHREIRNAIGIGDWPLFTAEQVHGNKIAVIEVGSALRSEEHTSELQSHSGISYAVFCLKKKTTNIHKSTMVFLFSSLHLSSTNYS